VGTVFCVPSTSPARISLPERYRVIGHIANGGMASVWEAHDELLDRAVAVKLLAVHLSEDDRARQRFQREARAAAGLSTHANVVTIYDVGEHDGRTFMVMELLRGGSLADKLRGDEPVAPETALRWLREAASALDAAHEAGVVHRDVKPANMLLDDRGRLAIADFGIARLALEDQLTATGQVLGTAAYISPEQAVGEPATAASDRYALGVVAYELLTGERPFQAEHFAAQARAHVEDTPPPASERNSELPPEVDAVLKRALAKVPDDRWPTSAAFVEALRHAVAPPEAPRARAAAAAPPPPPPTEATRLADATPPRGTPVPPRRVASRPPAGPPRDPRRRFGAGVLLAGLAGLVLVAVLAFLLLSGGDGGERQAAEATPTSTPERTATPDRTATPERTPEKTATPEPTAESTPEATGAPDLGRAAQLQVQGFNANNAGNYERGLALSEQALEACGGAKQESPCGYALYEKGRALNGLGRPDEAIPVLQQRLDLYGPNKDVERELKAAQKAAGKGDEGDD
jgi:serine/threonine-protein kinase